MEGSPKIAKALAVVVAKLVERSLPIPEVCGSKKRPGVAHFYKKIAKACDKKNRVLTSYRNAPLQIIKIIAANLLLPLLQRNRSRYRHLRLAPSSSLDDR